MEGFKFEDVSVTDIPIHCYSSRWYWFAHKGRRTQVHVQIVHSHFPKLKNDSTFFLWTNSSSVFEVKFNY